MFSVFCFFLVVYWHFNFWRKLHNLELKKNLIIQYFNCKNLENTIVDFDYLRVAKGPACEITSYRISITIDIDNWWTKSSRKLNGALSAVFINLLKSWL